MIPSKPHVRMQQATMEKSVNVLSPVMFIIIEADAFHISGRQHQAIHFRREESGSIGVLGSGMLQKGCVVNLGEPLCSRRIKPSGYEQTSQQWQGCPKATTAVGTVRSTPSAGKPRTWGRGSRIGEGEGTLYFHITPRMAWK